MTSIILIILSLIGSFSFALILILLHFIKPEFDPTWRMISEYEIGKNGWIMRLAFIMLSLSCFSLLIIFWQHIAIIGEILLFINSIALIGAAIFITDPIITPSNLKSKANQLHTLFGSLFILGFPISATIITLSVDSQLIPISHQGLLQSVLLLVWGGLILFIGSTIYFGRKKGVVAGPEIKIGLPNRLMMLMYIVWIIVSTLLVK